MLLSGIWQAEKDDEEEEEGEGEEEGEEVNKPQQTKRFHNERMNYWSMEGRDAILNRTSTLQEIRLGMHANPDHPLSWAG